MKKILKTAVVAALCAVALHAQTTCKIFGTVLDQDGNPVPAASLEVADQKSGAKRSLAAGADGSFTLPDLPPGTYQITATCPTCNSGSSIVDLSAGQTRNIQLSLNTQSATDVIAVDDHATTMDLG